MAGLSMGACLALRLAETQGDAVSGLVVVNPSLAPTPGCSCSRPCSSTSCRRCRASAGDIKKPGGDEGGYKRVPVGAAATLPRDVEATARQLAR